MVALDRNELEHVRTAKQHYNDIKKWSFEDFQGYLEKKTIRRKRRFKIFLSLLLLSYVLFGAVILLTAHTLDLQDRLYIFTSILATESDRRCAEINQTVGTFHIIKASEELLVHCSKDNLIIGAYEID